jgi:hypothetical protein
MEAKLVCSFFGDHIVISHFKQLFVKPEILPQKPFNAISHDSLSGSSADRYTKPFVTGVST